MTDLEPRPRTPWYLAVLGVLLGIGAIVVAAVLIVNADRLRVEVGENVFVNAATDERGIVAANNSPALARNPRDPDNLVAAFRVDQPDFTATLRWSGDGGETWESTALPLPEGLDRPFAPDVAFGPDGTLYVLYVNLTGAGNTPETLWLARSEDGGRTLSVPARVAGELSFQGRLAVGPDGAVHVTYLEASGVGLYALVGPARIVAVRSTDGGRSFGEPVAVSDADRERVGAATPVVTGDGTVVVVYEDYRGDVRDFQDLDGPVWPRPFALVASRSEDGGQTFESGVEIDTDVLPSERFLVFLPPFPSATAGPDGGLYVAWSDARHGDADVFLRRSPDAGRTWSPAVRVNDTDPGDGTVQDLPAVAVAPTGRIDIVFFDDRRRHDVGDTDVFLATSLDGGETFRNVRLSSIAFDPEVGPRLSRHVGARLGTRTAIVNDDDGAFAVWTDTRVGTAATNRQDLVAARVFTSRPAPTGWLVALGAAALVAVGVIGLWLRRGRLDS